VQWTGKHKWVWSGAARLAAALFFAAWRGVACACLLALTAGTVRADGLRGLVRLAAPDDRALFERVRGQASDLAVSLAAEPTGALEPSLREQLATARALAGKRQARVVIWATRTPDKVEIVVADLQLDRVLVRELEAARGPEDRSAQDEAAALVVRSALKASLAGEALGSSPKELLPVDPPPPLPEPPPEPPAPAHPEPPAAPGQRSARWLLALGALGGADGASRGGRYALTARAGYRGPRLELGLRGGVGLRADVGTSLARLGLAQHLAEAYVGAALVAREELRLSLLAGAGARVFSLHAESVADSFEASSDRKVLVALSALASFTWLPGWARWEGGRAGVALSAGVDVFPVAPELGYLNEEGFVGVERLWQVQPVGAVEVLLVL